MSECSIERGLVHLDTRRRFANRETLCDKRLRAPELFVGYNGLASALATARHRRIETGTSSFPDQVALELSERAENMKDQPAARCGGIDCFR